MARPYKLLRDKLRSCEITQEMLAEELRVGTDTISRKINAHFPWTVDQMYTILDLIGEKPESMHKYFPRNGQNEPDVIRPTRRRIIRCV